MAASLVTGVPLVTALFGVRRPAVRGLTASALAGS
jgi:hypothetical protein